MEFIVPATMLSRSAVAIDRAAWRSPRFQSKAGKMPLKEETLQQQLERAQSELQLAEKSLEGAALRRQPKWRQANSRVRQIQRRLKQRGKVVALDQELKNRTAGAADE